MLRLFKSTAPVAARSVYNSCVRSTKLAWSAVF